MIDESLEQRRYDRTRRKITKLLHRGMNARDRDWPELEAQLRQLTEEERRIAGAMLDGELKL